MLLERRLFAVKISDERVVIALPCPSQPALAKKKIRSPLAIRERMIDEKVAGFDVAAKRLEFARVL